MRASTEGHGPAGSLPATVGLLVPATDQWLTAVLRARQRCCNQNRTGSLQTPDEDRSSTLTGRPRSKKGYIAPKSRWDRHLRERPSIGNAPSERSRPRRGCTGDRSVDGALCLARRLPRGSTPEDELQGSLLLAIPKTRSLSWNSTTQKEAIDKALGELEAHKMLSDAFQVVEIISKVISVLGRFELTFRRPGR